MIQHVFSKYYPGPKDGARRTEAETRWPLALVLKATLRSIKNGSGITQGKQLSLMPGPTTLVSHLFLRKEKGKDYVELRSPNT